MTTPPPPRRLRVKLIAAAIAALLALLAAEVVARVYYPAHPDERPKLQQFHPFLGYSFRANESTVIKDRFGERTFTTNSLGLRGRDVPRKKGPNTFRIICVGGSTTENAYVNDDETYPAQLERMLQEQYPKVNVEVLNAGLSAYSTAHTLINFQLNLVGLEPDLLVVYQAINDLMPMGYPDFQSDYRNFYTSYHLRRLVETDLRYEPDWPGWLRRTGVGQLLLRARRRTVIWDFDEAGPRPGFLMHRVAPDVLRVYERNLLHLVHLARAADVEVCLSTFAHVLKPVMPAETLKRLRRFPWYHHLSPRAVCEALIRMNVIVSRLAERERTLFVDNDKLMPKDLSLFIDTCHMRPPALKLLAEHFRDAIVKSGVVDARSSG